MILYQLKCSQDHEFEAWFKDASTYDVQCAGGEISCPYCGSNRVSKAPMAPRLAKRSAEPDSVEARAKEVAEKIFQAADNLRKHVEESCDYVGEKFADEARKIHYGESDPRNIYGETSEDEAKALSDEGVGLTRIPWIDREDS